MYPSEDRTRLRYRKLVQGTIVNSVLWDLASGVDLDEEEEDGRLRGDSHDAEEEKGKICVDGRQWTSQQCFGVANEREPYLKMWLFRRLIP